MSSHNNYRVSKEIILNIAEHCDLETLSSLTQTCKDIHSLVTEYEHSLAQAKIAALSQPPKGLVLSSQDEQRCTISVRNSFATVRELDRRTQRCDSLLNRGAFLLTSESDILGMTQESLHKFKAGLEFAFCLADQLADLATRFTAQASPMPTPRAEDVLRPNDLSVNMGYKRRREATALRHAQIAYLRAQPSRALAWLVTLAAGASKGYARYSTRLLESDSAMAHARVMAYKEVLLRYGGSLVVWGFMRGTGTLAQFVKLAVAQCAQEVMFFEESGTHITATFGDEDDEEDQEDDGTYSGAMKVPAGLHMSIIRELNRRMLRRKRAEAEESGEMWDGEELSTREVWEEVDMLVAKEVGCETWRGYTAVKYPSRDDGV